MCRYTFVFTRIAVILISAAVAFAAAPAPSARPGTAPAGAHESAPLPVDKSTLEVLNRLKLQDPQATSVTQNALVLYNAALTDWHKQNDPKLKPLWAAFNKAHAARDKAHVEEAVRQIDLLYASLQPQRDALLAKLRTVLTADQIETVQDVLTYNKVKTTYTAYQQTFPELTVEQSKNVLQQLKAAREEAIYCLAGSEKNAVFKKYKSKIESYLTAQGYDVNKSYEIYMAKQKAEIDAKNAASTKPKKN
jgi:hypothetical protein